MSVKSLTMSRQQQLIHDEYLKVQTHPRIISTNG